MSRNHKGSAGYELSKARKRLKPLVESGSAVCWRCGRPITPDQEWDVGHLEDLASGQSSGQVAPEHRHRTAYCQGNRSAGGKLGRSMQLGARKAERRMPSW